MNVSTILSLIVGLASKALQWFRSYLDNRLQYVCINGSNSSYTDVAFGVPQGSVLGLLLYVIYLFAG